MRLSVKTKSVVKTCNRRQRGGHLWLLLPQLHMLAIGGSQKQAQWEWMKIKRTKSKMRQTRIERVTFRLPRMLDGTELLQSDALPTELLALVTPSHCPCIQTACIPDGLECYGLAPVIHATVSSNPDDCAIHNRLIVAIPSGYPTPSSAPLDLRCFLLSPHMLLSA
jgi:hypothetical protein